MAQENMEALNSIGTHQSLSCVDDVSTMARNIDSKQKDTEALLDASKQVGLNLEKSSSYVIRRREKPQHEVSDKTLG
jgi:hypothetical protein